MYIIPIYDRIFDPFFHHGIPCEVFFIFYAANEISFYVRHAFLVFRTMLYQSRFMVADQDAVIKFQGRAFHAFLSFFRAPLIQYRIARGTDHNSSLASIHSAKCKICMHNRSGKKL